MTLVPVVTLGAHHCLLLVKWKEIFLNTWFCLSGQLILLAGPGNVCFFGLQKGFKTVTSDQSGGWKRREPWAVPLSHIFSCTGTKFSTTGVKESHCSGGEVQPPWIYSHFPPLPPISSLSPSSSWYQPCTACAGGTAVEDIRLQKSVREKDKRREAKSERRDCSRWKG